MNLSVVNFLSQISSKGVSFKSNNNKINFTAKPDTFEKTTSAENTKEAMQKTRKEAEKIRKRAKKLRSFAVKEAKKEKWTRKDQSTVTTGKFTREYDGKILTIEVSKVNRTDKHLPKGVHFLVPEGKLYVNISEEDPTKAQKNYYEIIKRNGACIYTEKSLENNCILRSILFWKDGSLRDVD